jgi:hypothetical protein
MYIALMRLVREHALLAQFFAKLIDRITKFRMSLGKEVRRQAAMRAAGLRLVDLSQGHVIVRHEISESEARTKWLLSASGRLTSWIDYD